MVRNGTHYHRVKVPRDIVDRYGKRIEVVSLRTSDPKVAKAWNARITVDLNGNFDQVRAASITIELKQEAFPLSADRVTSITRSHAARIEEQLLVDCVVLFEAAVADRRSPREFIAQRSPREDMSGLLGAATGGVSAPDLFQRLRHRGRTRAARC